MFHTQPTTPALIINNLIHGREPINALPAFRSIETAYRVDIKLTHTGIRVRSRVGMGQKVYEQGNVDKAVYGKAKGRAECDAQRAFVLNFLMWARENMPTDEVKSTVERLTGGRQ
jgi:hypothetical protein